MPEKDTKGSGKSWDPVGGEGFAVDASLIAADANKQRSIPGSEWNKAPRFSWCQPRHEGVFGNPRRCGVWRGKRGDAEIYLALRSSRAVDRRDAKASVLRLCGQLSHRR